MSTLQDRLEDLATAAPSGGAAPGDLWERGVRRGRARRAGAVAAVAATVALVAGATVVLGNPDRGEPQPADVPFEELHLPEVVHAPGTWSDEEGPDGPLAAVGIAPRTTPEGLTGERGGLELFGVSAVDGRSQWLDLPGIDEDDRPLIGWFALSPDGRKLAWTRHLPGRRPDTNGPLTGWSVMDTTTREVLELADPAAPRLQETASDLEFSGDSRYLLTSYEQRGGPRTRGHQFVAWNVADGTPTVLEEPGHYWLPSLGSATSDVVWSRKRMVYRADPATGARSSYSLPQEVITASWAPDDRGFAYIGWSGDGRRGPWRLYAGRTLAEARDRVIPVDDPDPAQLLGWQDARHVVVGRFRSTVHVVDIVTGEVVEHRMGGEGDQVNAPKLAGDLWRNALITPPEPEGTSDPRTPFLWGGGVLVVALAGASMLRWRRRRA